LGRLVGAFAEQDAVVAQDADRPAVEMGVAADERRAIVGLELQEARAIDQPGDDLTHVEGDARVGGDDAQ